jgi:(p)ppGpp synthase/HD superfamily hydrolase
MELMACLQFENHEKGDFILQCAILHDVLEDTEKRSEHILCHFTQEVLDGVRSLTKDTSIQTIMRMEECLVRIKAQPREIWMVKMADRISNLQEPPAHWDREKIRHYFQESQLIYDELHEASPYLARRLALKIEEYRRYLD